MKKKKPNPKQESELFKFSFTPTKEMMEKGVSVKIEFIPREIIAIADMTSRIPVNFKTAEKK